jgi:DNA-binding XRE family transcriptional regulator
MELYTNDKTRHPRGGYDADRVSKLRHEMRVIERAYRLAELRQARHLNQAELGKQIGVGQRTVSKIERGKIESSKLETVRRYVEGLGGQVEVVARFGDEAYTIA